MNIWPKQELLVSYSQIAVYNKNMENPFSNWTEHHIKQGFAWREGTVSFCTLDDVMSEIEVSIEVKVSQIEESIRSIVVPFEVKTEGITISSILSKQYDYEIPKGLYELLFQAIPLKAVENGKPKVRYAFHFVACHNPNPIILKNDEELSPKIPLHMIAEPAL
ncbi:MAG: competence protein [Paenibacillus sp.]|jgi:hypothetical protein|nr:competence protein [Paenibacillus sp.]